MVRVENRLKCTWSEYLELMSGDWFDPPLVMRNFSLFIWNSQRNSNLTPDGAILNTTWRHSVEDFVFAAFIYLFFSPKFKFDDNLHSPSQQYGYFREEPNLFFLRLTKDVDKFTRGTIRLDEYMIKIIWVHCGHRIQVKVILAVLKSVKQL